jgi:hypothetical protein
MDIPGMRRGKAQVKVKNPASGAEADTDRQGNTWWIASRWMNGTLQEHRLAVRSGG